MRIFLYCYLGLLAIVIGLAGLRGPEFRKFQEPPIEIFPDMDRQPKAKTQKTSAFFADGRADRLPVPGTIPDGVPLPATYYATGKMGEMWGDGFPQEISITPSLLERGRQRYNINCAVCHGESGQGNGITSRYGIVGIANLTQPQFVAYPDGQIYYVIGHGKGLMGPYPHITTDDKWAIVAYVRALQRARNGKFDELPDSLRTQLSQPAPATPAP